MATPRYTRDDLRVVVKGVLDVFIREYVRNPERVAREVAESSIDAFIDQQNWPTKKVRRVRCWNHWTELDPLCTGPAKCTVCGRLIPEARGK